MSILYTYVQLIAKNVISMICIFTSSFMLVVCIAVLSAKARLRLASAVEHLLLSPRGGPSLGTSEIAAPEDPHNPMRSVTNNAGAAIARM